MTLMHATPRDLTVVFPGWKRDDYLAAMYHEELFDRIQGVLFSDDGESQQQPTESRALVVQRKYDVVGGNAWLMFCARTENAKRYLSHALSPLVLPARMEELFSVEDQEDGYPRSVLSRFAAMVLARRFLAQDVLKMATLHSLCLSHRLVFLAWVWASFLDHSAALWGHGRFSFEWGENPPRFVDSTRDQDFTIDEASGPQWLLPLSRSTATACAIDGVFVDIAAHRVRFLWVVIHSTLCDSRFDCEPVRFFLHKLQAVCGMAIRHVELAIVTPREATSPQFELEALEALRNSIRDADVAVAVVEVEYPVDDGDKPKSGSSMDTVDANTDILQPTTANPDDTS